MRINSAVPSQLPQQMPDMIDAQMDEALLERAQDAQKADGAAAIKMIQSAGVNCPLKEGPVGRLINIKV